MYICLDASRIDARLKFCITVATTLIQEMLAPPLNQAPEIVWRIALHIAKYQLASSNAYNLIMFGQKFERYLVLAILTPRMITVAVCVQTFQ